MQNDEICASILFMAERSAHTVINQLETAMQACPDADQEVLAEILKKAKAVHSAILLLEVQMKERAKVK